jgi:hypothetical protein
MGAAVLLEAVAEFMRMRPVDGEGVCGRFRVVSAFGRLWRFGCVDSGAAGVPGCATGAGVAVGYLTEGVRGIRPG